MTLDLTTLEASLKRDEELATRVPDPTAPCDLLDALLLMDQLCGALLARVNDCRRLMARVRELEGQILQFIADGIAADESLAEAVRALEECEVRLRCDGDLHRDHGLDDRARASWDSADKALATLIAISSLQPRKDTP